MKPITEDMLVDFLAGELSAEEKEAVQVALASDPALRSELAELQALLNEVALAPEPEPSAEADRRFAAMLAGEVARAAEASADMVPQATIRRLPLWQRQALKIAGIAAAIALIFTAGRFSATGGETDLEQQLVATRTLMLDLMKKERTSERIRATTVTLDLPVVDPETTENLGYLLRNDDNANVRLAALEALRRFPRDPGVREQLLKAMQETPPDVVRFELIETLVQMNEKRVLPYLEDLINADTLPQPVRDAAEMASFKLI